MKAIFYSTIFTVILILCGQIAVRAQELSIVAGGDTTGYNGDDKLATDALLGNPEHIAIDKDGNIYIADELNSRIRKVSTTGIITTVAGCGKRGFGGDGGPAIAATLNEPAAVTFDDAGNMYIADHNNARIRKVSTSGIISTVGGRQLTTTGSYGYGESIYPLALAVDKNGNIYFADYNNSCVWKINASGVASLFAGSGKSGHGRDGGPAVEAQFDDPNGIAIDNQGNVYISDYMNDRVRKVNTIGIISTVAGSDSSGYRGDGGRAVYARLSGPLGLVADANGNLYIADDDNECIRKVNREGIITTVVDCKKLYQQNLLGDKRDRPRYFSPAGLAIDQDGNIYFSDDIADRVYKVSDPELATPVETVIADNMKLFPNPAHSTLTIDYSLSNDGDAIFQASDVAGRTALTLRLSSRQHQAVTDITSLTPGMYLYKVTQQDAVLNTGKFVKE